MKDKLNARQKKFAEYYAQSGNTVQSAIKAGYSEKYANADACKILENPRVSEYIKELTAKAQQDRIITAVERQAILSDIAKSDEELTPDRIRAIDTLNKMTGEYLNKVEVSGTLKAEQSKLDDLIKQMSEDE
ncbi:terminase small subunit [bacterium]|nr:terminase small subunit [bacterium]